jgi:1-acyl-sn-glycerol-3-phosphate acyltransferase
VTGKSIVGRAVSAAGGVLRTGLTLTVGVAATLLACLAVLVIARRRPRSRWIDRIIRWWARAWLAPAGARVTVEGLEHIDPAGSYVVVSNHLSDLDIMALFATLPVPLRFLAKRELYRIPIFGRTMRAVGIIEVDRAHPDLDSINRQSARVLSSGRSIMVFAEGGRSRDGTLRPFKSGAFAIAVANRAALCPVTIAGSRQCWVPGRRTIHPGRIHLHVGNLIDTAGCDMDDIGRLRDQTRSLIETTHRQLAERLRASTPPGGRQP